MPKQTPQRKTCGFLRGKKLLIGILVIIVLLIGGYWVLSNKQPSENSNQTQCEFNEMIFYYRNGCSWCQKVKDEGSIGKIEALGIKVTSIETTVGPVEHQLQGVPTFVVDGKLYPGYKTFEQLKELLGCPIE